ncbi:hypothetical protein HELRODRAFT_176788 [Helobdella robusta]|uniref:Uncharacterized protein n=1 Tax=Helobdella robusta TaxID=6412 RepID=T1FAW9_HELRO|nr:hypothetical protein HELRODRAFT_176788 [Helobdella robusta]ESN99619.1 hypothetical protein HELRODRAFT_176788 [Helobdella robusta]
MRSGMENLIFWNKKFGFTKLNLYHTGGKLRYFNRENLKNDKTSTKTSTSNSSIISNQQNNNKNVGISLCGTLDDYCHHDPKINNEALRCCSGFKCHCPTLRGWCTCKRESFFARWQ